MDAGRSKRGIHLPPLLLQTGGTPVHPVKHQQRRKIILPRKSEVKLLRAGEGKRTAMGNMVLGTNRLVDLVAVRMVVTSRTRF